MDEMKAGPELDARLCALLGIEPIIPISTDWAACGKAIDMLAASYDIRLDHARREYHRPAFAELGRGGHRPSQRGSATRDDLKHAFSLAACEALEARAEAES